VDVLVGLGGNLGDVLSAFARAESGLARLGSVRAVSPLYRTKPVGPQQPDFKNKALVLDTRWDVRALLCRCQELERTAGRVRDPETPWGPRPLDIDLLLIRGAVVRARDLWIPHPRFHERAFALAPAATVAGDWMHPLLGLSVAELATRRLHIEQGAVVETDR
jgi:2-amino-4-hydroxy-6-hydroxymethyldihydropteridine diphosphokinase